MNNIVKVTQNDINRGKRGNECQCALARAVRRKFQVKQVSVGGNGIFVGSLYSMSAKSFKLTRKIEHFINKFDEDKKTVKPTTFRLITA